MANRHSGESRNPEKSKHWTPAFAGVTNKSTVTQADDTPPTLQQLMGYFANLRGERQMPLTFSLDDICDERQMRGLRAFK